MLLVSSSTQNSWTPTNDPRRLNPSQLESEYDDRRYDESVDEFLNSARRKLSKTSGFDTPSVYVNFAHGDEGPAVWYGARKLEKLSRLKRIWDPHGLFNFYNPVPASWQENHDK